MSNVTHFVMNVSIVLLLRAWPDCVKNGYEKADIDASIWARHLFLYYEGSVFIWFIVEGGNCLLL